MLPLAYLVAVAAVALSRAIDGHPTVASTALTPDALAAGRVWLLASSAVVVNGVVVPQLVVLAATLVAALRMLGARFVLLVMVAAHAGATLLAYALLAVATGDADGSHNRSYDYGISAVWLGLLGALAIALVPAAGRGNLWARIVIVAALASAVVAVAFFPLMPATEHGFAFAIGAGLTALRGSRRLAGRSARSAASTASSEAASA